MTATTLAKKATVRIVQDPYAEDPAEWGGWDITSFGRNHKAYKHPNDVGLSLVTDAYGDPILLPDAIGLRRRLSCGTAFVLSYFEHGQCRWSVKGTGPQCAFDTAQVAGLAVWKDSPKDLPRTVEEREEHLARFLDTYTDWCNGEAYGYIIESEDGNELDSCWGFFGLEDVQATVKEALTNLGLEANIPDEVEY